VVTPATKHGKQAVGRLLAQQQQQQQQKLAKQERVGAKTGTTQAEDTTTDHENDASVSDTLHDNERISYSKSASFMLMLAQLQGWKKRHGSCHVPAAVFDKPELAQWVAHLRQRRAAAAAAALAAAASSSGEGAGSAGQAAASIGSSDTDNGSGSTEFAAEEAAQTNQQQSEQQQRQKINLRSEPLHLRPGWLKQWHIQELDAVGFIWQPSQVRLLQ
jgi:hypothetical protein